MAVRRSSGAFLPMLTHHQVFDGHHTIHASTGTACSVKLTLGPSKIPSRQDTHGLSHDDTAITEGDVDYLVFVGRVGRWVELTRLCLAGPFS